MWGGVQLNLILELRLMRTVYQADQCRSMDLRYSIPAGYSSQQSRVQLQARSKVEVDAGRVPGYAKASIGDLRRWMPGAL